MFLKIFPLTCLVVYINLYMLVTFGILFSIQPPTRVHTYTCGFFVLLMHLNQDLSSTCYSFNNGICDIRFLVNLSKWNFIMRLDQITGLSCSLTTFKKKEWEKTQENLPFFPHFVRNISSQIEALHVSKLGNTLIPSNRNNLTH